MSATERKRRRKHSALWVLLGAVVAVVLVVFKWLIATPGPMGEAVDGSPIDLTLAWIYTHWY